MKALSCLIIAVALSIAGSAKATGVPLRFAPRVYVATPVIVQQQFDVDPYQLARQAELARQAALQDLAYRQQSQGISYSGASYAADFAFRTARLRFFDPRFFIPRGVFPGRFAAPIRFRR